MYICTSLILFWVGLHVTIHYPCTQAICYPGKGKVWQREAKYWERRRLMNGGKEKEILAVICTLVTCWMRSFPFSLQLCPDYHPTSSPAASPPIARIPVEASAAQPYKSCNYIIYMQLWFIPPNQQTLSIYSIFKHTPNYILRPLDAAFGVKEYRFRRSMCRDHDWKQGNFELLILWSSILRDLDSPS